MHGAETANAAPALPGPPAPQDIDAAITTMQANPRDEWRLAAEAKQKGLSPEDAAKGMDLSRFRDTYGAGVAPNPLGIRRIYDIVDGKAIAN